MRHLRVPLAWLGYQWCFDPKLAEALNLFNFQKNFTCMLNLYINLINTYIICLHVFKGCSIQNIFLLAYENTFMFTCSYKLYLDTFFFFNERSPESFSLIYKEPLFVTFPISLTSNKQVELKRELSSPIVMISFITSCGCSLTVTVLSMGGKIKKKKKNLLLQRCAKQKVLRDVVKNVKDEK